MTARIDAAIAYVRTFSAAQVDGSETRQITRTIRGAPKTFSGQDYLIQFSLPNFYFHVTTAYAILRHNGVEIGKLDFLGPLP